MIERLLGAHPTHRYLIRSGNAWTQVVAVVVAALLVPEAHAQASFSTFPKDLQLYPRSGSSATVSIEGTVSEGYDRAVLEVYRDGELDVTQTDSLGGSSGSLSFAPEITAELAAYDFEVYLVDDDDDSTLVGQAEDVVAGDVYLIDGQSNAQAARQSGAASANTGVPQASKSFIRSFGIRTDGASATASNLDWHLAEGDAYFGEGAIGQWGLWLGHRLVQEEGIPVAIISGARGGRQISYFQRRDSDPDNLNDNYGRLLYRAKEAGVVDDVRALLWHQGESGEYDGFNAWNGYYFSRLERLYEDWKEDYESIERVYLFQVRRGCTRGSATQEDLFRVMEAQRRFGLTYSDVGLVSTTGIDGRPERELNDDNVYCHYTYEGYKEMAGSILPLVQRDLYGGNDANAEAPNPEAVYYSSQGAATEITIETQASNDLIWQDGAEANFDLVCSSAAVDSGEVQGSALVLHLDDDVREALEDNCTVDGVALRHLGPDAATDDGPKITNAREVGLLVFSEPVEQGALPVELIAFTATLDAGPSEEGSARSVLLQWSTASESNNAGFHIEKALGSDSAFEPVAFVEGRNTTTETTRYSWRDEAVEPGVVRYRLRQQDLDGSSTYSDAVELGVEVQGAYAFEPIAPNPVRDQATVRFMTRDEEPVTLSLYNALGQRVRVLYEGTPSREAMAEVSLSGSNLSSGLYFVRLEGKDFAETQSLMITR